MESVALWLGQVHTPWSGTTEAAVRGKHVGNHATVTPAIASYLGDALDRPDTADVEEATLIVGNTDHWLPPGREHYESLRKNELVDDLTLHDQFATYRIDGVETDLNVVEIEGYEASYKEENRHFLLYGVDIAERPPIETMSRDEAQDIGNYNLDEDGLEKRWEEAEFGGPSHPFVSAGGFGWPHDELETIYKRAKENPDITPVIELQTGYESRLVNPATWGRLEYLRGERDIVDYADAYDIPILPGLDLHVDIPERANGAGIVTGGLTHIIRKAFEDGTIPTTTLLDEMQVINNQALNRKSLISPGSNPGLSMKQFARTYPDLVPGWEPGDSAWRFLPERESQFVAASADSDVSLWEFDPERAAEHAVEPRELLTWKGR